MIGYTTEELIGSATPDFYDDPKAREVVLARLKRDGYLENHEVRIRAKDGSVRWCLFSLATSVLAGESVIIGGLYDISQRKEAEETLKLYRRIFETSQDGIQVFDAQGKLVVRNPAHKKLTGMSDADVAGKTVDELVPESARVTVRDGLESQRGFRGLVDWPGPDGEALTFDLSVLHIPGPDGKLMYTVGMGRDVTEQHEAQLKTVAALNKLEQANKELRNAQSQLVQSEKMASLGLLVAGIAHEINTPVGAIGSMHDTLIRAIEKLKQSMSCCEIDSAQSDQMATVLGIIDDANRVIKEGTSRVTTIVRRLRSFARLDEADLKEVDIHEGIEDTLTLIHHEIKNRIKVVKNFGELPRVTCFPGRLNQVFLNLLNNARQAIEGEGTITITTAVVDRMVEVSFTDSGKGIAPDNLARIFDPGFTTKGVGVGTGLGLSICYRIMEDHKGSITASSEVGKGTTLVVSLPLDRDNGLDTESGDN
jgi:PAS domain S-box-containing protein